MFIDVIDPENPETRVAACRFREHFEKQIVGVFPDDLNSHLVVVFRHRDVTTAIYKPELVHSGFYARFRHVQQRPDIVVEDRTFFTVAELGLFHCTVSLRLLVVCV